VTFFRVLRGRTWRVRVRAYDLRECPECCAIVSSDRGQKGHAEWHEDQEQGAEEETGVLEMAGE
jgi:hypothetical protein